MNNPIEIWKKGLTIGGRKFDHKELLAFCSENIVSVSINPWEKEIYRFIITWLSDSDHIVQFSSGTTGKSKEIRLSKKSMIHSACMTLEYFSLSKGNTALLCMPVDYIAGKMMIVRSMIGEMDLYLSEPRGTPDINILPVVDFCAMVPLQASNLLMCREDLLPLRKLILGGAAISLELEKLLQRVTTEVYATYGMAESSSHVAIRRLNGSNSQKSYVALPGVAFSKDDRGCLVIETNYLPEKIITNDLIEFTSPVSFTWLGRYDNLINSGGVKIVPEEVEAMIASKTLLECVVVGLPDEKLGQKLVFVFEKDQAPDSFHTLKEDLGNILPRRWRPKDILMVDKFPRNDVFKIDRQRIIEMLLHPNT